MHHRDVNELEGVDPVSKQTQMVNLILGTGWKQGVNVGEANGSKKLHRKRPHALAREKPAETSNRA